MSDELKANALPDKLETFTADDFKAAGLSLAAPKLSPRPAATATITPGVAATTFQVSSNDGHAGSGFIGQASGAAGSSNGEMYYTSWQQLINTNTISVDNRNRRLEIHFYDSWSNFLGGFKGPWPQGGDDFRGHTGTFKFYM